MAQEQWTKQSPLSGLHKSTNRRQIFLLSFRPDSKLFFSGEAAAEKHPEKRMKAAYAAYEERQLPLLKKENPNMRLSQLKQMLKKDWMKAPENPMNQRIAAYNEKL